MPVGSGTILVGPCIDAMFPELVEIGESCVLAQGSLVLAHDASFLPFTGEYRVRPVKIGNRVSIGYRAVVLPGVTIGDDCIIGACAVVTRDVPAGSVAAGIPARVIGTTVECVANRGKGCFAYEKYGSSWAEFCGPSMDEFKARILGFYANDSR